MAGSSTVGGSDWVDSWADGLELLPPVEGFVLGAGMFSGYEQFWVAVLTIQRSRRRCSVASRIHTDRLRGSCRADRAPSALYHARARHLAEGTIVRSIDEIPDLRPRRPRHGLHRRRTALVRRASSIAGLLDELRLIVHPILVGAGQSITGVLGSPRCPDVRRGRTGRRRTGDADLSATPTRMSDWRSDPIGFNESVINGFARTPAWCAASSRTCLSSCSQRSTRGRANRARRRSPISDAAIVISSSHQTAAPHGIPTWFRHLERIAM